MLVKILGILDLLAAIIFFLSTLINFIPDKLIIIIAGYLIIKGAIFAIMLDIASILDIISGAMIYLSTLITLHPLIVFFVCLFIIQKAFFSMVS